MNDRIEILTGRETLLLLEISSLLPDDEPKRIDIGAIAEKYSLLDTEVTTIFTVLCEKQYLERIKPGWYKVGEQSKFMVKLRTKYIIKANDSLIENGMKYDTHNFVGKEISFENHEGKRSKSIPKRNNKDDKQIKAQKNIKPCDSLCEQKTINNELTQAQDRVCAAKEALDKSVENYLQKEKEYLDEFGKLTRLETINKIQSNL